MSDALRYTGQLQATQSRAPVSAVWCRTTRPGPADYLSYSSMSKYVFRSIIISWSYTQDTALFIVSGTRRMSLVYLFYQAN